MAPPGFLILGRGTKGRLDPVPELKGILQDGSAWTVIADWSEHPEMVGTLSHTAYGLATLWGMVRVLRIAPVSREMLLNFVAQHSLGLPRSY